MILLSQYSYLFSNTSHRIYRIFSFFSSLQKGVENSQSDKWKNVNNVKAVVVHLPRHTPISMITAQAQYLLTENSNKHIDINAGEYKSYNRYRVLLYIVSERELGHHFKQPIISTLLFFLCINPALLYFPKFSSSQAEPSFLPAVIFSIFPSTTPLQAIYYCTFLLNFSVQQAIYYEEHTKKKSDQPLLHDPH